MRPICSPFKTRRSASQSGGSLMRSKGEIGKAYIILKEGAKADAEGIMAHCHANLAAYKCPRKIQFVKDVPCASSGNITRRELATIEDETVAFAS